MTNEHKKNMGIFKIARIQSRKMSKKQYSREVKIMNLLKFNSHRN